MARPKKDPAAKATALRILDAAELEFGRIGFERARLSDIAAAVGVRRPSLLHHFKTKDALHEAVLERAFSELSAEIDRGVGAAHGLLETVDAVTAQLLGFAHERPGVPSLLVHAITATDDAVIAAVERHLVPLLDRLVHIVESLAGGALGEFPVREAVTSLFMNQLVRAAAAPRLSSLWQDDLATARLLKAMIAGAALSP